jgi:glucose 1-dehydrogenase
MARFDGKVALVTGAARGIGRGIALRLASEGADVVVNDYANLADAQAVAGQIGAMGRRGLAIQADVADRAAVEQMFAQAIEQLGRIDIAVANAGMSIREPVVEAQWEHVRRTIEVSQFGVFHTCQLAAQQMVRQGQGGKIVIVSSVHAELGVPGSAAYNMAKAAINHLCRTMAAELAREHINVNAIEPGWIDTPGERRFASDEQIRSGGRRIPWGRLGTPDDIAAAAAFLASDDADYVTGAVLRVDGGYTLGLRLPESQE